MRTGYEMPAGGAANGTTGAASQLLPVLKPGYRIREFTGPHVAFSRFAVPQGRVGDDHELEYEK
ncbi:MAG: hypothetical protein QOC76_3528 [Mycobacterium sp.]|jgi:hypothetical protein|nr:hypothetical protein [Mycobacterium sp.]